MSYKTRQRQKSQLDYEADLYAAIATMDKLAKHFDRGYVEETLYRRQLKGTINDVFKTRMALEEKNFDLDSFVEKHQLNEKFPNGMKRLNLLEGLDTEDHAIGYADMTKLPVKAADYVASAIELLDILHLKSIARVELVVPLLDEMYKILQTFPSLGEEHWVTQELNGWRLALLDEAPTRLLDGEDLERLEFEASRWLNEFRGLLKNM